MLYEGWAVRRDYEHEHTRYLATMMVNTSFNAPKKAIQPGQLYQLPEIDGKQGNRERTTYEEMEAMRQRLSKELGRELHFVKMAEA